MSGVTDSRREVKLACRKDTLCRRERPMRRSPRRWTRKARQLQEPLLRIGVPQPMHFVEPSPRALRLVAVELLHVGLACGNQRGLFEAHQRLGLVEDRPLGGGAEGGSVSKVEMATPTDLIYKVLFPSISTFETPP